MGRLSGKSVIVTGASRGIGAAAAEVLAAEGAALLLLARNGAEVEALAARLRSQGASAEAMPCDVADYAAVAAAVARAESAFGKVDGMIANAAAIDPIGGLDATDPAAWGATIDVNLKGVHHCLRAVLPGMRARGSGVIVTLGSGAAQNPLEGWSAYCASKAAVLMLMRCAHLENKGRGVRLHSLSPGTVATDMQRKIKASGINPVSQMDFSQHAPVDAPARALAWLLSQDAAEFAGQEVSLRDPAIRARVGLS